MQEYSKQRRRHSAEFKAEVLQACAQPGASTAGVALAFGLNANLVRQWRRGRGVVRAGLAPVAGPASVQRFVPLKFEEQSRTPEESAAQRVVDACIDVQLRRGDLAVSLRWPAAGASECARLLRELLR